MRRLLAAFLFFFAASVQAAEHRTHAVFTDITDPDNPVVLWEGSNVITGCGVRNMMALAIGATTMGASSGAAGSQGELCAGLNGLGEQKVPESGDWTLTVGGGSASAASHLDVLMFNQGAVEGDTQAEQEAAWEDWFVNEPTPLVYPYLVLPQPAESHRRLYWDGASTQGVRFYAVFDGSIANFTWCEYAIRTSGNGAGKGALGFEYLGANYRSGWMLNHKLIDPCITKSSGQQIQATITITWE